MRLDDGSRRRMNVFYATRDEQSRRIAERVVAVLQQRGIAAAPYDLTVGLPAADALAREPIVVLIAAVRYGRHLAPAARLLANYRALVTRPPLALASVNLTARKPGKDTAQGNPYLRKLIARQRLTPALAAVFAGRLDYPRYGLFDRQVIRLIMGLTGGPTDPATQVEYTSWPAVDAFTDDIVRLHQGR
jgi:menaquinone-dependent protoporphyrinogen oxidase